MSIKDSVLALLESNRHVDLSGEQIAKKLSVSRTAIWNAINILRSRGYIIEATRSKGYRLSEDTDKLSTQAIIGFLKPQYQQNALFVNESVDSTNQVAKKMSLEDAKNGTVILAEHQSAGRGRLGRSFYSPKDKGIYMSIILRPDIDSSGSVLVTIATAVAVCRAITSLMAAKPVIKWVNDIFLNGRKICGILTEAVTNFENGMIESIVIGIGINFTLSQSDLPDDIKDIVGSIFYDCKPNFTRNQLVAHVVNEVLDISTNFSNSDILKEYKDLSFILGQDITFFRNNQWYDAKAMDIDVDGGLIVKDRNGNTQILRSGEVSIRGYKK